MADLSQSFDEAGMAAAAAPRRRWEEGGGACDDDDDGPWRRQWEAAGPSGGGVKDEAAPRSNGQSNSAWGGDGPCAPGSLLLTNN
jgi:hypothetical protein